MKNRSMAGAPDLWWLFFENEKCGNCKFAYMHDCETVLGIIFLIAVVICPAAGTNARQAKNFFRISTKSSFRIIKRSGKQEWLRR